MHFLTGQTTNQLSTEFTKSIVPVDRPPPKWPVLCRVGH